MLFEPTTLAATASALAVALETYGAKPGEVFARAGLNIDDLLKPGARYPYAAIPRLWTEARLASGDPCIGLAAARRLKPQALHALGLSWIASRTLLDGFRRMARYSRIANTSLRIGLETESRQLKVVPRVEVTDIERAQEGVDATLAFIVTLCRFLMTAHFSPEKVAFRHPNNGHLNQYIEFFKCPVEFDAADDALWFDATVTTTPIPAGNEELARETDRIAERYLATLEPSRVQDKVRAILLTMLPSGETDQRKVAQQLNRSVSALQRQLRAEGATYREVLEDTRRELAIRLVRDHEYSIGQIAYLLGFSDQANFSRAFRRWTGSAPTELR